MTTKPDAKSPNMSAEARAFLRDAVPPPPRKVDPSTIAAERRDNHATFAPPGLAVAAEILERVETVEMGGVRVQICTPRGFDRARSRRAILYFFGGGYVVGGPEEDLAITARLADLTGIRVYAPYYRLAPEHPYPAALEDALAVYGSLSNSLEPGGLVVAGESAGGNLALATILGAPKAGLGMPAAAALLSPWVDLTNDGDTMTAHRGLDPSFSAEALDGGEGAAYAGARDRADPAVSPLYVEDWSGFPPTLITTGTRDLLLSDCARLSTAMRRAGVEVRLDLWEGMWHVFECYPEIPEGAESLREIAAFLLARLGCAAEVLDV